MLQKFDPKNRNIMVHMGSTLLPRSEAKVSVHLDRLADSAHALAFERIPDKASIQEAIFEILAANGMDDEGHIRLTLTNGPCLIVLVEWKAPVHDNAGGIKVISSSQRRNNPPFLDSKVHHHNVLNNIMGKIEANISGADDALMLDHMGFVSELNDANLFMVREGKVYTPLPDARLHGITRGVVMEICSDLAIPLQERNLSLTEFYNADVVFATGTMGELTPVAEIDGRKIINRSSHNTLENISTRFQSLISQYSEKPN